MTEPVPLREALDSLFWSLGVSREVSHRVMTEWAELAGPEWAERGEPAGCRRGVLTVVARDGSAATFLDMRSEALLDRLANTLGPGAVTAVRVKVGYGREPS